MGINAEYIITDNPAERVSVVWYQRRCTCRWEKRATEEEVVITFTHDEARKLAAFIMAQVKND